MQKTLPRLGKRQLQIMQVLWERQRATAREITARLNQDRQGAEPPVAHSTVQTLLRELEVKGAAAHDVEDRTFVFRPLLEEPEVTARATHDFLTRVFGGSAYGLVAHLLRHEELSAQDLDRLKGLIAAEKTVPEE